MKTVKTKRKYRADLDLLTAKELKLLDEACTAIEKLVKKSPEINKQNLATRDAHATSYAFVKGSFHLDDDFEEKSIFPKKNLDCLIRISNAHMKIVRPNRTVPAYGFSVKLSEKDTTIANFPLVNFPLFPIVDVSRFLQLFISINNYFSEAAFQKFWNLFKILQSFLYIFPDTLNVSFQNQVIRFLRQWRNFILSFDYHSIGVYRMGDALVKLRLVPIHIPKKYQDDKIDLSIESYLREHKIYETELQAQYCYDEKYQPVNFLNKMWKKSEYVPVGKITITEFLNKNDLALEALSFNPFDNIAALQPVGKLQRLRDAAYKTSLETRNKINKS